ncbi:hypothetical protein NDU88_009876 [Pleurodeles waltl]|uniref:Uncharacterized protein n=1 Tax=Pleurodeles waltl TaxID=8319 RepID=A0AAV7Q0L7_PLEWA|nr:hypothetical protein NDU88_009876 [Pleurodeles waltl]
MHSSELCRPGPSESPVTPYLGGACLPGFVAGAEKQRAPQEELGHPQKRRAAALGLAPWERACGQRARHAAVRPHGAAECAEVGQHFGGTRRLPGRALQRRRVVSPAPEALVRRQAWGRASTGCDGHFPSGAIGERGLRVK